MKKRSGLWLLSLPPALMLAGCDNTSVTKPTAPTTFQVTVQNVSKVYDFPNSGSFTTPVGSDGAGPALPGQVFEVTFEAPPGSRLSFATMFAQSNDFFYAPDGDGIALWDDQGHQVTGDVTDQVHLWDAGTEINQEPGVGPDQAPRQSAPNTGAADPNDDVRMAPDSFGNLPPVSDVIQVTLHSMGPTTFRLTIADVDDGTRLHASDGMTHPVPLSPGVWVVHTQPDPLFTVGQPDRGEGLEHLAEDGNAGPLADAVAARTGLTSPIAPGAWALSDGTPVIFKGGMPDLGMGLESAAEDGDPTTLAASLASSTAVSASGVFNTPDGASSAGPALPGQSFTFTVTAQPGDHLSFESMLGQTNDLFFSPGEDGIDLFPGGGALDGDVTGMIYLWDAGTEANQFPGIGIDQAPRQSAPNTGAADPNDAVRQVDDGFHYPAVGAMVKVTIHPTG
jgi:hypothetical protein